MRQGKGGRGGGREGGTRLCCARVVIPVLRAIEPSWMSTGARISADWFGLGVIRDVISEVTPHAPAARPCIAVTSLRSCDVHPPLLIQEHSAAISRHHINAEYFRVPCSLCLLPLINNTLLSNRPSIPEFNQFSEASVEL